MSPRIFGRNSFERNLLTLYNRLVDLGMGYHSNRVYLADLEQDEGVVTGQSM
jgi:hypothetical protein